MSRRVGVAAMLPESDRKDLAIRALARSARLSHDVLALAGSALATRQMLFDFIVEELAKREPEDVRRIRPLRVALQNQRDDLLAFAGVLARRSGRTWCARSKISFSRLMPPTAQNTWICRVSGSIRCAATCKASGPSPFAPIGGLSGVLTALTPSTLI